jgi:hypothetical protein
MNDAAWWARVVQARTERDGLRPHRVLALRKDGHEAAIDLKAVPGIGAEIVLTVDGELRKTRLFRFTRAGGTGRRDCGRADDLRWKGVGVIVAGASALGSLRASGHESLFRLPATWILRGGSSRKTSGTCCGSCREGASQASVSGQWHADHAC